MHLQGASKAVTFSLSKSQALKQIKNYTTELPQESGEFHGLILCIPILLLVETST